MIDKKVLLSRIIMLLYMVAVAVLCFAKFGNGIDLGKDFLGIAKDKIAHFMMFIPFPVLASLSFYRGGGTPKKLILFVAGILVAGLLLAGTTELVQGTLGYRSGDIDDFRADALGLFTGSVSVVVYCAATKKW